MEESSTLERSESEIKALGGPETATVIPSQRTGIRFEPTKVTQPVIRVGGKCLAIFGEPGEARAIAEALSRAQSPPKK